MIKMTFTLLVLFAAWETTAPALLAQPFGRGRRGQNDAEFQQDRATFRFLLQHHREITRRIEIIDDGVVTLTESDNPEVATAIGEHVSAMHKRAMDDRPVRMWDPLFAALFRRGDQVQMEIEPTDKGVKVTETSKDAETVNLIQAHAKVISLFVERGFDEARKSHAAP